MNLSDKDRQFIWHPYTQMKTAGPSIAIVRGKGSYLYDEKGKKYIDGISSWWTNMHGHSHPYIAKKVSAQLKKLEHVIFAGFTHQPAVQLAEMLLKKLPSTQEKIFYSDNGSTAVEAALKMALQYWYNRGSKRTKVIAFKDAYHGDTFGAMAASGKSAFTAPFDELLFEVIHIDAPVKGKEHDSIAQLRSQISDLRSQISCFIFEPLVQGTAGMAMHSAEALSELISICKKNNILTIADEVMTGFGRTGKFFACDHLSEKPDIICMSKGITGGTMALGATSCTNDIYDAFYSDDRIRMFFHGHSYTANPVACSAAIASLELFQKERTFKKIKKIERLHKRFAEKMRKAHGAKLKDVRVTGTIIALEIGSSGDTSYFSSIRDRAYNFFLGKGIILRPLGNIIYIMPPYCISEKDLNYIYESIEEFLASLP